MKSVEFLRVSITGSIYNSALNFPYGKGLSTSKDGKTAVEYEADDQRLDISLRRQRLGPLGRNNVNSSIVVERSGPFMPIENVLLVRRASDNSGLREPALERNIDGSLDELSIKELGAVAIDLRRAVSTINEQN